MWIQPDIWNAMCSLTQDMLTDHHLNSNADRKLLLR